MPIEQIILSDLQRDLDAILGNKVIPEYDGYLSNNGWMDALRVFCAAPDRNHAHIAILVDGFNIAVNQVDMDVGFAHKFDNPCILDFFILAELVRESLHLLSVHLTLIFGMRLVGLRLAVVDFLRRADVVPRLRSACDVPI